MRAIILPALVVLLLPLSTVASTSQASNQPVGLAQSGPSTFPCPVVTVTPPTSLNLIIHSVFGIAFYNSSGKITIQPASLFLNMTVKSGNSTGVLFSINSGRIIIGPSPVVSVQRVFTVVSGQAFLTFCDRLTVQAQMVEVGLPPVPSSIYTLFLTGPSRLALTTATNNWGLFTSLFGFLYNSQQRIGLFFVVGFAPGDVDEDGRVDIGDLTIVASNFGADTIQSSMSSPSCSPAGYSGAFYADINGQGRVGIQDLVTVASNFGQTY